MCPRRAIDCQGSARPGQRDAQRLVARAGQRDAGEGEHNHVRHHPAQGRTLGRVWISDRQYFEGVAEAVRAFPIGGYLPAQRWLSDRWVRGKGQPKRRLSLEDVATLARIVFAQGETRGLVARIDATIGTHGGWPLK